MKAKETSARSWMPRFAATLAALASLCIVAPAQGATAIEPGYPCQLVRPKTIGAAYGKSSRVEKHTVEVSEAYGEGTYTSGCTVRVTKMVDSAARSARRVRLGQIRLFSIVPATGAAAGAWDPDKLNADLVSGAEGLISSFGGAAFAMPAFGQTEVHAFWIGNKQFSAEGFWRHADSGSLTIDLRDRSETVPRLERLLTLFGGGIVPGFAP